MVTMESILEMLAAGEPARLIPVAADTSREQRITSSLLATFTVVPEFAFSLLEEAGAPAGKRAKIDCYTEVVLKDKHNTRDIRPDGLILVTRGSKSWSALVEAKIGGAELKKDQIEAYLDLARSVGIDAVITISNQFATTPCHHPVAVSGHKTRTTGLYHFSWLSLIAKAIVVSHNQSVSDPEQSYILNELVRHLDHEKSGVLALTRMGTGWKEMCDQIQHGAPLRRNDPNLENAVASWHQLSRFLAVGLTSALGRPVQVALTRKQTNDPAALLRDDLEHFAKTNVLQTEFDVPNAASKITFSADFTRRTISISMRLEAPKDKTRATASINWLTRQLKPAEDQDLSIWAHWPRRTPTTMASLQQALDDPQSLVPNGSKEIPSTVEVVKVVDLAGRFRGPKTFVEDASAALPAFYQQVGQNINRWVPKPPKMRVLPDSEDGDSVAVPNARSAPAPASELHVSGGTGSMVDSGQRSHEDLPLAEELSDPDQAK